MIRAWVPYVILVIVIILARIDNLVRPIAAKLAADPKHPFVLPDWINFTQWLIAGNPAPAFKGVKPWFTIDWIQIGGSKLTFPF